jgi:large conductance mechanosensitive channel
MDAATKLLDANYLFRMPFLFDTLVATDVFAERQRRGSCATQRQSQQEEVTMKNEFISFLKQYGVIGLAIAVIIGGKLNAFVTAVVDGIMMPIITFFVPGGAWRSATLDLGSMHFLLGPVIGAAIDFVIVAWLVFWFSKKVLKEETVAKK